MYAPFFGLQHPPFSIAPDPRYLFMSERHREALAHLLYGLDAGGGFVLLTGEIGTGKTTVCRCFLEQIPAHCNVAYIFNPKLTVPELLRSICDEFGVAHQAAAPGVETVRTAWIRSTPSCCSSMPPGATTCSSSTRRRTWRPTCWSSCAC